MLFSYRLNGHVKTTFAADSGEEELTSLPNSFQLSLNKDPNTFSICSLEEFSTEIEDLVRSSLLENLEFQYNKVLEDEELSRSDLKNLHKALIAFQTIGESHNEN